MEINKNAPLVARHSISITAPVAVVWHLLTEIEAWPRWHSAITRAELKGVLAPEAVFHWTSGGTAIVSTIRERVPQERFGWEGKALGTSTAHVWILEATATGTLVTTEESMSGWLIRMVKLVAPGFLDNALQAWLAALKKAAEAGVNRV